MRWQLLALGWLAGCGGRAVDPGPETALAAWADAVERQDAEAVHALLDPTTQAELSVEELRARMEGNAEELREHAASTRAATPRARAVVRLPGDERVVLHREDGHWKLSGELLGVPTPTTPEDAVHALRRALRHPGLEGVLRVVARRPRAAIVAEVERFLDDTADVLAWRTELAGNEATVRTAGGWSIRVVRESGQWRVEDVTLTSP